MTHTPPDENVDEGRAEANAREYLAATARVLRCLSRLLEGDGFHTPARTRGLGRVFEPPSASDDPTTPKDFWKVVFHKAIAKTRAHHPKTTPEWRILMGAANLVRTTAMDRMGIRVAVAIPEDDSSVWARSARAHLFALAGMPLFSNVHDLPDPEPFSEARVRAIAAGPPSDVARAQHLRTFAGPVHTLYPSSLAVLRSILHKEVPRGLRTVFTAAVIQAGMNFDPEAVFDDADRRSKNMMRLVRAIDHFCHIVNPEDVIIDGAPGLLNAK